MTEEQLRHLFILLHRPIPWDPVPWWVRLDKDQIAKFNDVQVHLNARIAEIEAEKLRELTKIVGISI